MKKNWKYGEKSERVVKQLLQGLTFCLLIMLFSCNGRNQHKHIPTNETNEMDGLQQPANRIVMSEVKSILPKYQSYIPIVKATGIISYDPRLLNTISVRFSGRIEKLYVRFNFEKVTKGQRIMDIYSPEILTAQNDFIFLLTSSENDTSLINTSTHKLQLLGLTSEQLNEIVKTKKPINPLPVYSPYAGHIHDVGIKNDDLQDGTMKSGMNSKMSNASSSSNDAQLSNVAASQTSSLSVIEGMYLQKGQPIFSVYNTENVWAVLNIFPSDAALIKIGDPVSIVTETDADNVINAKINYIEPVAGQNASSINGRVYLQNTEKLNLKIGTLLSAEITTEAIYGMWLPRNAVVNLGQNQVVFIKTKNYFTSKIIQTGITTDSLIQIISGLYSSDQVAANAQFLVDSESFIKTSNDEQ